MRIGGAAVLALMAGACAAPRAVLLPGEDGHPIGALAVIDEKGGEEVMDQPLRSARMAKGHTSLRTETAIKPAYQQLMSTLPPPAKSFTLYFVDGTSTLLPTSRPVLDQIRAEVAARSGAEVQVTGHTDTVGSDDDNDRLSQKRADEVMAELIAESFPREALSAVGRGEREPAVNTGDNVANADNRRVEVIVR